MRITNILASLSLLAFPSNVWAQGWPTPPDAPLRVQVQISLQRPIAVSQAPDAQQKDLEDARRTIYESFKGECAILSATFDSNCRLVNLNANTSIMERGAMTPSINANGNASFELTARPAHDPK